MDSDCVDGSVYYTDVVEGSIYYVVVNGLNFNRIVLGKWLIKDLLFYKVMIFNLIMMSEV